METGYFICGLEVKPCGYHYTKVGVKRPLNFEQLQEHQRRTKRNLVRDDRKHKK